MATIVIAPTYEVGVFTPMMAALSHSVRLVLMTKGDLPGQTARVQDQLRGYPLDRDVIGRAALRQVLRGAHKGSRLVALPGSSGPLSPVRVLEDVHQNGYVSDSIARFFLPEQGRELAAKLGGRARLVSEDVAAVGAQPSGLTDSQLQGWSWIERMMRAAVLLAAANDDEDFDTERVEGIQRLTATPAVAERARRLMLKGMRPRKGAALFVLLGDDLGNAALQMRERWERLPSRTALVGELDSVNDGLANGEAVFVSGNTSKETRWQSLLDAARGWDLGVQVVVALGVTGGRKEPLKKLASATARALKADEVRQLTLLV